MIPKTEIRYSRVYNRIFDKEFNYQDTEKLEQDCKEFESVYNKHINHLLTEIEKSTGEWEREYIPIYMTRNAKSISDPLTLKYRENAEYLFIVLAHELLHNNIKKKFLDPKKLHEYMEPIFDKIILSINPEWKPQLEQLNQEIRDKYAEKSGNPSYSS